MTDGIDTSLSVFKMFVETAEGTKFDCFLLQTKINQIFTDKTFNFLRGS